MSEPEDNEESLSPERMLEAERIAEALVFASAEPVSEAYIAERIPDGVDVAELMAGLAEQYRNRGVNLVRVEDHWAFRTAADLSFVIHRGEREARKLTRAALEVLSIIAYHQPVTRAEIEEIRGVQTSKGTLDVLMEAGWVRFRGRRRTPGRRACFWALLKWKKRRVSVPVPSWSTTSRLRRRPKVTSAPRTSPSTTASLPSTRPPIGVTRVRSW